MEFGEDDKPCCKIPVRKKQNNHKILCGLWTAHVVASEYNNNGECACINCPGAHCQRCPAYANKVALHEKHICTLCMQYVTVKGR